MTKKDDYYRVTIRKPVAMAMGAVDITDTSFRFGQDTGGAVSWEYEIPFSEITEIEHKRGRAIVRGKLKDGGEFDFRFSTSINPSKTARWVNALTVALAKIVPTGTSVRRIEKYRPKERPPLN